MINSIHSNYNFLNLQNQNKINFNQTNSSTLNSQNLQAQNSSAVLKSNNENSNFVSDKGALVRDKSEAQSYFKAMV